MEQTVIPNDKALPEAEAETEPIGEDTIPNAEPITEEEAFLTVKFNKEQIPLSREEAITLAQKGMKYDSISDEYERLRADSQREVSDMSEFLEEIPEIASKDQLPKEVTEAAEKSRRGLLFEYLLHCYRLNRAAKDEAENRAFAAASSTGSLSADDRRDPAAEEFIRGVWGR